MNDQITSFLAKFSSPITYAGAGGSVISALNSAWFWAMIGALCAIFTAWSNHHHNRKKYKLEEKKAKAQGLITDSDRAELADE